ncbi:MAG: hypothetical protein EPGJADBJ_04876 [Saprospiraceae bacterium]|nr:hypothetical protein [Saprospiraceae bacterium]
MSRHQCKNPECEKQAISFSEYCGEHSDPEAVVAQLQAWSGGEEPLYISGIELPAFQMRDKKITLILDEVSFEEAVFINCQFWAFDIHHTDFLNCRFTDCMFNGDFLDSNFMECQIQRCEINARFDQCSFQDGTVVEECIFNSQKSVGLCDWVGTSVYKDVVFRKVLLQRVGIHHASIQEVTFEEVQFVEGDNFKTAITDCYFKNVLFESIKNDWKELDGMEMCVFVNTVFKDTPVQDNFDRWNAFDEDPVEFYKRVLHQVLETDPEYVDNLHQAELAARRLENMKYNTREIRVLISNIFTTYFSHARETQDIEAFGKIVGYFSDIPKDFILDPTRFLPSPQKVVQEPTLKLAIQLPEYTLTSIANLLNQLRDLEKIVVRDGPSFRVFNLGWGSVTITLASPIIVLLATVYYLYKGANLYLEFEEKRLGNKKLLLEIAEKEAQLKDKEMQQLEKEKLREEIWQLQQKRFEQLQREYNYKPEKYLSPPEHARALEIGQAIRDGADTLDIYLNILQEETD